MKFEDLKMRREDLLRRPEKMEGQKSTVGLLNPKKDASPLAKSILVCPWHRNLPANIQDKCTHTSRLTLYVCRLQVMLGYVKARLD